MTPPRIRRGTLVLLSAISTLVACRREHPDKLSVGIAPYQDIAMLVTAPAMGFDTANGVSLELKTMAWEEIPTAVASAAGAVDVGFGSLAEYLAKQDNLNRGASDPVLFIMPLYVYRGGGFISFNRDVPVVDSASVQNPAVARRFLSYRIGAQRNSIYEMILDRLASLAGDSTALRRMRDTPLNEGLLAAEQGSLDISAAGLTQLAEAEKRGGRPVLIMDDLGFADITGLMCRKSVCESKRVQIDALVRAWFQSVDYVMADLDRHSVHSLNYLRQNAATEYTMDQYKSALGQEYLPRTLVEARTSFLQAGGRYDAQRIGTQMADYLVRTGRASKRPTLPSYISVQP
jgi:ABC-type nitrate/sulfonate/bicarbonate transport system substrate-binding protein